MFDGKAFGQEVVATVKGYVEKAVSAVSARVEALEKREPLKGERGSDGARGEKGADGIGLAGAIIDRSGSLVVTMTDGTTRDLGPVVGKDGQSGEKGLDGKDGTNGKDGADGLGFDDLEVVHDGERGFTFKFVRGDLVKEFKFAVPMMIYRGVFKDGQTYVRGDTVTWGGSLWHCDEATVDKPEVNKAWTLAAKRGRDGKQGEKGRDGPKGKDGRDGRDLTQLGHDGSKW